MSEDWPPELRRLLAKKVIRRKTPTRLNLLSVKCRTFIQENRAVQNVILSQILTAFLNFTISIVKTPQASKKQQIFRNPSKMPLKKSTSEKCLPNLSLKSRRSGGQSSDISVYAKTRLTVSGHGLVSYCSFVRKKCDGLKTVLRSETVRWVFHLRWNSQKKNQNFYNNLQVVRVQKLHL